MPKKADNLLLFQDKIEDDSLHIKQGDHNYSDEEIIDMLAPQIAYLLDKQRDWLLGKLYRLDILDQHIKSALHSPHLSPSRALAILVLNRQKDRIKVKQSITVKPLDPDGEFGDLIW